MKQKKSPILLLKIILVFIISLNVYSQETYVFFGSYNWSKNKSGIYVYQLDTTNGKLKKIATAKNVLNPSYLTLSQKGDYVYSCTDTKIPNSGSVSSFRFDRTNKKLHFINKQKSEGENPIYLALHENGKWLIEGNYNQASVSLYPIKEDGSIDTITQHLTFQDSSVNKERQQQAHIHSTVFSPDYTTVFFPDLGADKIRSYSFNSSKEKPLEENNPAFIKTELEAGPRHFTFHPNKKFGYSIEELAGCVSVYSYKNGSLNFIQRVATHPENITEGFESSDVHVSPNGKFLYASNRGKENNIAIFSIDENGLLTNIGYQPTLGNHPRVFALDESGKFLITTNTKSGDVFVFKRNSETGLLTPIGKRTKIKNVTCVKTKTY